MTGTRGVANLALPQWWLRLCGDDRLTKIITAMGAAGLLMFWGIVIIRFGGAPAEDAFMLFRYAANWAAGHGIAWNVGERPVEGATDFLWLSLIALGTRWAHEPVAVAFASGALWVTATIVLLWFVSRGVLRLPFVAASGAILSYLASPVAIHVINGFSPPMFSFLLLLETACLLLLLLEPDRRVLRWLFPASMLLVGLTRPEGNVFNLAALLVYLIGSRRSSSSPWRRAAVPVLLVYALPGIAYFFWRWNYFGLLWPLPFLVKALRPESRAIEVARNVFDLAIRQGPALILIALFLVRGARGRRGDAAAAMAAVPAAALMLLYVPFVQSQNVVYRFQFSPLAVLLTLTAIRVGSCAERREFGAAFLGAAALVGATAWSTMSAIPVPEPRTETILLGRSLHSLRDSGLSLATTEAGRLPYYSGWRTLDSYGLNDPVVATTGLTREHWLEYRPDVVLIHPTSSWDPYREAVPQERSGHRRELMENMRRDGTYRLVAMVRCRGRLRAHAHDYDLYFANQRSPQWGVVEREILAIPGAVYVPLSRTMQAYLEGH